MADPDYAARTANHWRNELDASNVLPLEIGIRLRRAVHLVETASNQVIGQSPLTTYGDYQVLALIHRQPASITSTELADELLITKAGMSSRIARLVRTGLLQDQPNPDDGRSFLLDITPLGSEIVETVAAQLLEAHIALLEGLASRTDQNTLNNLLHVLLANDPTELPTQ